MISNIHKKVKKCSTGAEFYTIRHAKRWNFSWPKKKGQFKECGKSIPILKTPKYLTNFGVRFVPQDLINGRKVFRQKIQHFNKS